MFYHTDKVCYHKAPKSWSSSIAHLCNHKILQLYAFPPENALEWYGFFAILFINHDSTCLRETFPLLLPANTTYVSLKHASREHASEKHM